MDGMGVVAETRSITASLEGASEVEMAMLNLRDSKENEKEFAKGLEEVEMEEEEEEEDTWFSGILKSHTQRILLKREYCVVR